MQSIGLEDQIIMFLSSKLQYPNFQTNTVSGIGDRNAVGKFHILFGYLFCFLQWNYSKILAVFGSKKKNNRDENFFLLM